MITVENISKFFAEIHALKDISFSLQKGNIAALIGENGAGKSTLMRIMCGFLNPDCGNVTIFGNNIEKNRIQALSHIGYVPEISSLYGDMYVYDFLKWIAGIHDIAFPDEAILKVADKMQITGILAQKNATLSKGYKKRVEIASALLHEPEFLILDEPTDGLDPNQKHHIREFVKNYAKKNIVLISTHVLEDASIANRILMLSKGILVENTDIQTFKKISKNKDLNESFRIMSQQTKEKQ